MDSPQVIFWHPITSDSTSAVVTPIVMSAVLPAVTATVRQFDTGYVRGLTKTATGYELTIDRVVPSLDGSIININPATYSYPITDAVGFSGASIPAQCYGSSGNCGVDYLIAQIAKGPHPADGSWAVSGSLVYLEIYSPGVYEPIFTTASPFHPGS